MFYLATCLLISLLCFFNDTATTEIYTLSLHDALPISLQRFGGYTTQRYEEFDRKKNATDLFPEKSLRVIFSQHKDRKSTRLNSSHANISYAVFCLKKKNISTVNHQLNDQSTYHRSLV